MNPVVVWNHAFVIELLKQLEISERLVGDIIMEWPVAGVLTLTIKVMPEKSHFDAACKAVLEADK